MEARSFGKTLSEIAAAGAEAEDSLWNSLSEAVALFLRSRAPKESKSYLENLEVARELERSRGELQRDETPEGTGRLESLRKRLTMRGALSDQAGVIRECLDNVLLAKIEKSGRRFKESFLGLFGKFAAGYEALKTENAFLDFDDLLVKAYALFDSEDERCAAVKERYRKKFEHVLVDEFQDTSRLQAQWIDRLARPGGQFIIGDAKQSIYRFRNADLEAFREKEREIRENPEALHIELEENYRSRKELIDFANGLFAEFWREDGFCFEPLSAKRPFTEKKIPSVEFLCVAQAEDDEDEDMTKARVREARTLALRIRELVEGRKLRVNRRDGSVRDAAYGDFAILFRAMTGSNLYENELRELGIPYFVVRGRGFYEKQEVADLVNFLSVLEDPDLDFPMVAVLRSPLVGLSEDGLFWLSRVKEKPEHRDAGGDGGKDRPGPLPIFEAFAREDLCRKLSDEDAEKLARFLVLFSELRERKDQLGVAKILERLISETSYDIKLLGKWQGKQKTVNVWKLVEIARQFSARETFALRDFIAYLEDLRSQDLKESEAQVELERGNSVKLMTIHKAKGLEFPAVVLADLGRKKRGSDGGKINYSERFGLGFKVRSGMTGKWREGLTFSANREWESRQDSEEQKRLFYVAVTRAEEHLILSGVSPLKELKEGKPYHKLPSWMEWLRQAFHFAVPGASPDFEFCSVPVSVLPVSAEVSYGKKETAPVSEAPFKQAVPALKPVRGSDLEKLPPFSSEKARALSETLLSFEKDYFKTRDIPVSAMLEFEHCPGCYHDLYEMRVPARSGLIEEKNFSEDGEPLLSGRAFGTLFHSAMQYFDFSQPPEKEIVRLLESHRQALAARDLRTLEAAVRGFLASEPAAVLRGAEIFRELPFIYRLPRGKLTGQIDLLAKTASGNWLLLDYKTDKIRNEDDLAKRRAHYELQLRIYALALGEIAKIRPERGALYFTAAGKTLTVPVTERILAETKEKISRNLEEIAAGRGVFAHRENCQFQERVMAPAEDI